MRLLTFVLILLALSINITALDFTIVESFPFDQNFSYYETWDIVEGRKAGSACLIFPTEDRILLMDNSKRDFQLYDQNFHLLNRWSQEDWTMIYYEVGDYTIFHLEHGVFALYFEDDFHSPAYFINASEYASESELYRGFLFLTDNTLFLKVGESFISFLLLPDGEVEYRGIEETLEWLDAGNDQRIGLWQDDYGRFFFGEQSMGSNRYYTHAIWKNLIIPDGEFESLTDLNNFGHFGVDSRGLNYYIRNGSPFVRGNPINSTDPFQVYIAIVDTWTRNVTFRVLPYGAWDPPRNEEGLFGMYPNAVHPNGDVYFFDADREAQEFQLKRLTNDWWAELGVDQRRIGRSTVNHVPLLEEPGENGPAYAHNFENEFVWVLEERQLDQLWYRIRKVSGAEGWIPADTVYWPEY